MSHEIGTQGAASRAPAEVLLEVDDLDLPAAAQAASSFPGTQFDYIVTANVDHAIRYYGEASFRKLYAGASLVLLDSRFLARLLRLTRGQAFRTCPGSDLTTHLFESVIRPDDRVVLVGSSAVQAGLLRSQYGLGNLVHIDPPMRFIKDPEAVERCLQQVEAASPFRYCFLAIGSPQQEMIASMLRERGKATGVGLCIGASVDFLTGKEERAPHWMQESGLEWAWRLIQNPRRMAHRYLVRGPKIFGLLSRLQIRPRKASALPIGLDPLEDREEATGT
jgi:exopolysaccharide biosynthesis WecB/TagA/CpsF family protein